MLVIRDKRDGSYLQRLPAMFGNGHGCLTFADRAKADEVLKKLNTKPGMRRGAKAFGIVQEVPDDVWARYQELYTSWLAKSESDRWGTSPPHIKLNGKCDF